MISAKVNKKLNINRRGEGLRGRGHFTAGAVMKSFMNKSIAMIAKDVKAKGTLITLLLYWLVKFLTTGKAKMGRGTLIDRIEGRKGKKMMVRTSQMRGSDQWELADGAINGKGAPSRLTPRAGISSSLELVVTCTQCGKLR